MALLLAALVAVLPFRSHPLPPHDAFILVIDAVVLFACLGTAIQLYAQYYIVRQAHLLVLGCGYLFAALVIIPHALTFPGAFAENGLLGAGPQTTAWLYLVWHVTLPPTAIVYILLKGTRVDEPGALGPPGWGIGAGVAAGVTLVVALTWLVTAQEPLLPRLMVDGVRRTRAWTDMVAVPILAMSLASIVLVWLCRSSRLDLWLLVVLWAWFMETLLLGVTGERFSLVWYAGRVIGALCSSFLAILFAFESSAFRARLAVTRASGKFS